MENLKKKSLISFKFTWVKAILYSGGKTNAQSD